MLKKNWNIYRDHGSKTTGDENHCDADVGKRAAHQLTLATVPGSGRWPIGKLIARLAREPSAGLIFETGSRPAPSRSHEKPSTTIVVHSLIIRKKTSHTSTVYVQLDLFIH